MKVFDIIIIVFLFSILIYGFYTIQVIKDEGSKCMARPLEYRVKFYTQSLKSELSCSCYFNDSKYLPLFINSNGTTSSIIIKNENNTLQINTSVFDNLLR